MVTKEAHDLGTVYITFVGDSIASFRFANAWPTARFRPGRHFRDAGFKLPTVDGSEERCINILVPSVLAMRYNMPYHTGTDTLDQSPLNWNQFWKDEYAEAIIMLKK